MNCSIELIIKSWNIYIYILCMYKHIKNVFIQLLIFHQIFNIVAFQLHYNICTTSCQYYYIIITICIIVCTVLLYVNITILLLLLFYALLPPLIVFLIKSLLINKKPNIFFIILNFQKTRTSVSLKIRQIVWDWKLSVINGYLVNLNLKLRAHNKRKKKTLF